MIDLLGYTIIKKRNYVSAVLATKKIGMYLQILVGDPTVEMGAWDLTDAEALPTIAFYDEDDVEVLAATSATKLSTGVYTYEWDTAANGEGLYRWLIEASVVDGLATYTVNNHGHILVVSASTLNKLMKIKHDLGMPEEEMYLSDYTIFLTFERATSHITGLANSSATTADTNDAIYSWAAYECYNNYMVNRQGAGLKNSQLDTGKLFELRGVRDRALTKVMQGDKILDTRNAIYQHTL